jgi:hypothetical protein
MSSPCARLASYGLVLVGLFATAYALGERLPGHDHGAGASTGDHAHDGDQLDHEGHATDGRADPGGNATALASIADDGTHRLSVVEVTDTSLVIELRRDGEPVIDLAPSHGAPMHLVVIRSDLSGFQHVHPQGGDGRWRADDVDLSAPGSWRVVVDALAADGTPILLGTTVDRSGVFEPIAPPTPAADAVETVPIAVGASEVTVVRDGLAFRVEPTDGLVPYLGAPAHLVAFRAGDLAYTHLHPASGADTAGRFEFDGSLPGAGTYRVFLQFGHRDAPGGVVTVPFTIDAGPGATG